jgi:membrane fusion protein (multidrug efflux system)
MKSITTVLSYLCLTASVVVLSSCGKKGDENAPAKIQPVSVRLETMKPSKLVDAIRIAGIVKASEDVNMSPEEGGVVKEWKVKKGDHVKKGEVIVTLRDEVIKAGYDAALAQYNMAELNLKKQKGVFDQQGISELQYKNLQYTRDAAKANADLMKARWERTQLRSPIDGVLDNTIPFEGEFAPPGIPIARVVNTAVAKIQAEVPELFSGTMVSGMPAMVTFDALPGDTLRGTVTFVGSTVSSANRTLSVEMIIKNPFAHLKPEMVAKVQMQRETKSDALMVSESIIQLVDRDRSIVYVEIGGKAEERRLTLGGRQGNMVEVLDGLKPGDHLIVAGYQKLVNGTPVVVEQ